MRPAHFLAVFSFCAILPIAVGQPPAAPVAPDPPEQQTEPAPTPRGERPLTPEQLREKQIQMHDPLDKSNPLLGDREQDKKATGAPAAAPAQQRPAPAPLPGSVAASNQANPLNAGPQVVAEDGEAPVQDYSGPAVLSRSYTISRPMVPQSIRWSPTLGFSEIFQSGLPGQTASTGGTATTGTAPASSSFGYSANWGLTGRHFWKHDQLGIDYRGSMNQYTSYGAYNGTNQSLNADFAHSFSRHLVLNVVSSGSIYSQNYALENPTVGPGSIANINLAASPNVQLLNQGTRQWMNQTSVTWNKSARLSVTGGGGLFFVDRTGVGIPGNTGYQAQADVNYRYTRKMTVGVYYTYTNYVFSHRINLANFHTFGGIYSYALNRSTQIRLRAGATRLENESLQTIQIPAEIAAFTGQQTGIISSYQRSIASDISAQLVKDFGRQRTVNFAYARGISPGNGLLLTSLQESYSGSFALVVFRQYRMNFAIGRDSLTAQTSVGGGNLAGGNYDTSYVTFGITRTYRHGLAGEFRADYRSYNIMGYPTIHNQFRISTGVSWSPGENWLRSLQH